MTGRIDPDQVIDLQIPIVEAVESIKAMDERRDIKTKLRELWE